MAVTVLQEDFDSFTDWTATGTPAVKTGRTGKAVSLTSTNKLRYTIPGASESDTIIVGFAWKLDGVTARGILNLLSDTGATGHIQLASASSGVFNVTRGISGGTNIGTTTTGLYTANTWVYLELQVKLGDSPNGFVKLRVNGVERINNTGIDTRNAGTKTTFDMVELPGPGASIATYDDLYIITGTDGVFADQPRFGTGPFSVIHESFNNLAAWTTAAGSPAIGTGRTGTGIELDGTDQAALAVPAPQQSYYVVVGFAFYATVISGSNCFTLYEGGTAKGALQISATGVITFAGAAATPAATITASTWYYIELQALISAASGAAYTIRVNDVVKSSVQNTAATATTAITSIRLGTAGAGTTRFDDLYMQTGTLADFEGDQTVVATGTVDVWNGSAFVDAPVRTWSGSAFADAVAVKTWNGSAFV